MSTPKTEIELYPLEIAGKVQWVKKGQYAAQVAQQQSILLKSEIKREHVMTMLEAVAKGTREMNPEMPAELHETMKRVCDDYDAAVAEVKRLEDEEAEKKAQAERDKKAKEEAEAALFTKVKDEVADFGTLSRIFDTGENMDRCVAKGKVSDEQLLVALRTGMGMKDFSNWMIGDLVVELENRGQLGVVAKLSESMGAPYANIYNASKTARNVPPDKRTKGVSYTIFAEIANARYSEKDEEHTKKLNTLIDKAASGEIASSQEARKLKDAAKGKTPPAPVLPEEDGKREFIVIDHDNTKVEITLGFPRELFENGAMVIDKRTGKYFGTFREKAENRWKELPIYKKPEATPEPPKAPEPKKKPAKKK